MRLLLLFAACVIALPCMAQTQTPDYNMDLKTAGIELGELVSGRKLTPDSLKDKVVLLEFWSTT